MVMNIDKKFSQSGDNESPDPTPIGHLRDVVELEIHSIRVHLI